MCTFGFESVLFHCWSIEVCFLELCCFIVVCSLSSVAVSPDEKSLCGGFEDSRLRVWSLIPEPLPLATRSNGYKVSNVSLAGDCSEDVEERFDYIVVNQNCWYIGGKLMLDHLSTDKSICQLHIFGADP